MRKKREERSARMKTTYPRVSAEGNLTADSLEGKEENRKSERELKKRRLFTKTSAERLSKKAKCSY